MVLLHMNMMNMHVLLYMNMMNGAAHVTLWFA